MKQVQARGILLLAFTLFFSQLYGQSTNGSIGGTIEDVTTGAYARRKGYRHQRQHGRRFNLVNQ